MEGLRPDRDEVDSFQRSRKAGKGASKAKAKAKPETATASREPIKGGQTPQQPNAEQPSKTGTPLVVWLVMVLITLVVSWFGWESYQQKQKLEAANTELQSALVFMRQSKLLLARLEGELSETGAELIESDTGAQKKMAFLESEVRKLWGVAYDRNKKAIAGNNAEIKQQAAVLNSLKANVSEQSKGLEKLVAKTNDLETKNKDLSTKTNGLVDKLAKDAAASASLQAEVAMLREQNTQLADQLKAVEDASSAAIADIKQSLVKLKDNKAFEQRVKVNEVAIEAIDASRLQLNERIVDIDRRLNDLQLTIKPTPSK